MYNFEWRPSKTMRMSLLSIFSWRSSNGYLVFGVDVQTKFGTAKGEEISQWHSGSTWSNARAGVGCVLSFFQKGSLQLKASSIRLLRNTVEEVELQVWNAVMKLWTATWLRENIKFPDQRLSRSVCEKEYQAAGQKEEDRETTERRGPVQSRGDGQLLQVFPLSKAFFAKK